MVSLLSVRVLTRLQEISGPLRSEIGTSLLEEERRSSAEPEISICVPKRVRCIRLYIFRNVIQNIGLQGHVHVDRAGNPA